METKKTWENAPPVLIPRYQALALPLNEDKQRKACPRRAIFINTHYGAVIPDYYIRKQRAPSWGVHLIIYIKGLVAAGRYKINPRRRSQLHYRRI